jgi:RNA polymerase sigma-70 factor (TIGR02943 family)
MENELDLKDLVETYTNDLYSWAYYKVSDAELAKDLVQETFLAAAEKIFAFKGKSSPKTWLFAILNHKIIDVYRKKLKQPVNPDNQVFSKFFDNEGNWHTEKLPENWNEDEKHLLDDPEFNKVLKDCLEVLPEKWKICVKLKFLSEKSGEEICQELDIAPTNFWQMVHRAKLQLRDCIENKWFKN